MEARVVDVQLTPLIPAAESNTVRFRVPCSTWQPPPLFPPVTP